MNKVISLKNITKIYDENQPSEVHALIDITVDINEGEFIAICGTSGSGKTTLMNIIGCMAKQTSGNYYLYDRCVDKLNDAELSHIRNKNFGFVFQDFALIPYRTVSENVSVPLLFSKSSKKDSKKQVNYILDLLNISDLKNRQVSKLSGGQKQRVAIARALVNEPHTILADEPTGALDISTSESIIECFKEINKNGKTVIIITHDTNIAQKCDRIIRVEGGRIVPD